MLRREQKIRNIILFTLFSLVFIGVGYAVISSNLTLNGSMRLNKITWDVHFENFEELYDNTVTATKTLSNNNTSLTYNVNLNKPGDIFEFTIDVVNKGNIDAMLSNIGKNGLTSAQQQVMDYSLTYLDGTTPTVKDSLKIGEVETFVISVKTKANITNAQLNATDTNLTLTFTPTYVQEDGTRKIRNTSLYSKIIKQNIIDDNMSNATDNYGTSKFYQATTTNNNITFNNMCWKIIRINGNSTIRIIYNGLKDDNKCLSTRETLNIGISNFNSLYNDNTYLGYMYGLANAATYEDTHKNIYESNIKIFVDNWYNNNINSTNYKNYVSDTLFCLDRTISGNTSSSGFGTVTTGFYSSRARLDNNQSSLVCSRTLDRFTVNDTVMGNGDLKYPVGLITSDELVETGLKWTTGSDNNFLVDRTEDYWTMSPSCYYDNIGRAQNWILTETGHIQFGNVNATYGVRPVINLKQGVKISSGNGTPEDPYVVN